MVFNLSFFIICAYKIIPAFQQIYYHVAVIRYHIPALDAISSDFVEVKKAQAQGRQADEGEGPEFAPADLGAQAHTAELFQTGVNGDKAFGDGFRFGALGVAAVYLDAHLRGELITQIVGSIGELGGPDDAVKVVEVAVEVVDESQL